MLKTSGDAKLTSSNKIRLFSFSAVAKYPSLKINPVEFSLNTGAYDPNKSSILKLSEQQTLQNFFFISDAIS